MRSLKRKVILFIDQCPAQVTDWFTEFKKKNFPLQIVPLNIREVSDHLTFNIKNILSGQFFIIWKKTRRKKDGNFLNILEVMTFMHFWNTVSKGTISNCFSEAGFPPPGPGTETEGRAVLILKKKKLSLLLAMFYHLGSFQWKFYICTWVLLQIGRPEAAAPHASMLTTP